MCLLCVIECIMRYACVDKVYYWHVMTLHNELTGSNDQTMPRILDRGGRLGRKGPEDDDEGALAGGCSLLLHVMDPVFNGGRGIATAAPISPSFLVLADAAGPRGAGCVPAGALAPHALHLGRMHRGTPRRRRAMQWISIVTSQAAPRRLGPHRRRG